ncbi:MAG: DNA polymerase III subunit beta [Acidimicrobiia bacterium]|nr:DNA polymerase III subunit beta [Acidimicrobiia bacterium]MBV9040478.1 DNA polymerase III subunit beta [Acidimicrobiia bacterium]
MKFRAERDALLEAITTAGRAAATRGTALPALTGVRLEVVGDELHLAGTDLDVTIQVHMPIAGGDAGVCVIPARLATDIVRGLDPGSVSFEVDENEARIAAGPTHYAVRVLPPEEFLRLPEPSGDAVTLAASDFADALRQVVPAASRDEARPILTGVLMAAEAGGLRLVATDSYRLSVRDLPGTSVLQEGQTVLVPSRALAELNRVVSGADQVTLRLASDEASFEVGDTRLTTRLIEGDFPNYRQLIPQSYPNRLIVGKEPFLNAIRRVKLLAKDATPVRLTLKSEGLELVAVTQDVGQAREDLEAKYEGSEMVVAFNPEFLIDGVEAIAGDEVQLDTLDALKPATVRSTENPNFLYLLMPVRVS